MFENIRLITKKDNKICEPDLSWTAKSTIHCCCELNFGLGSKITWPPHHSIPLTRLIDFYNTLIKSIDQPKDKEHQFTFVNNHHALVIVWSMAEGLNFTFTFKYGLRNNEREVFSHTISYTAFYAYWRSLFFTVMQTLTKSASEAACVRAGELFYKPDGRQHEFKLGQKVTTGAHVKKERVGYIINRFYQQKRNTNVYQLLVNDKKVDRWYLPTDLQRI